VRAQARAPRPTRARRWIAAAGLVLGLAAFAAVARAQPADPPLNISADRMSGTHGPAGDEVILEGHVRIRRGRTVVTSEHGRYVRDAGMLYLDGNVRLVDSTTTITCDQASYSEIEDVLQLSGNVVLVDQDATLRAPVAVYDRAEGRADLYGGVEGRDKTQRMTSQRAIYVRDSLLLQARGQVRGYDEENDLELRAEEVDYNRASHEAVARTSPSLHAYDKDKRETVVRARELRLNTETRVAEAIDSVRVERDTLQARGNYGLFDDRAGRAWLFGSPRVWDDQTTVTGDTLELWSEERELERVIVRGSANMDYEGKRSEKAGEKSRLSGRRFDVYFTDREIDSLVAVGSARDEYEAPPVPGKTAERNVALGDTITVFFVDREIDRARVVGNASGAYTLPVNVADTSQVAEEVVRYDGKVIDYIVPESKIILEGASHLVYRDLELRSKRVEFDIDQQSLVATGKPELLDRGDKVLGREMTYDLESRVGNIYEAETAYEKGIYHGQQIRKGEAEVLDVKTGIYSTCDLPEQHYHFRARWMKIYLKDKVVAKPVVFYVKKVPLLVLPFWVFPIKPGRHSGFLLPRVEFGFTNRAGQFVRNAGYYWAPNDYMDLLVSGDYYQFEPSWVVRGEANYKLLYVLDGRMDGSLARNEGQGTEDWDFNMSHAQELSPRTRLVARGSFISSRDYNSSNLYGRSLSQRLNRFLTSSLAFSHNADWATLNAIVERRQDLDADASITDPDGPGPEHGPEPGTFASLPNLSERLPSLSISFPTRTIGALPLLRESRFAKALTSMYLSLDARFESQHERRAFVSGYETFEREGVTDSINVIGQQETTRRGFRSSGALTDSRRLFGWLNVQPSVFGSVAVFDFDEIGNKVVPTGTWSSTLTSGATFYRAFKPPIRNLLGVRHVLAPRVALAYSPEFPHLFYIDPLGIERPRFRSFGSIGVSGSRQFQLNMNLDQRWQVKLKRGEETLRLDNLVSWSMAANYDFLYADKGLAHPLSTIFSSVSIQPPGLLNANLNWTTDVYRARPLRTLTFNTGIDLASFGRNRDAAPDLPVDESTNVFDDDDDEYEAFPGQTWNLGVAYSYAGGRQFGDDWSNSQTANLVGHVQLTPGWALDYSASYDVTLRELGTQRFALIRDLHCWQAIFTRTFAPDGEAEYYFRLAVKDQKEIYIERGTRSGSIGGIQ
jgi:lipopolysaccharide export system protein LptA